VLRIEKVGVEGCLICFPIAYGLRGKKKHYCFINILK